MNRKSMAPRAPVPLAKPMTPALPSSPVSPKWLNARTVLLALALCFWGRVLFTNSVLLPGEFLRGFAPFGDDARAPWTILQWDALGQYFPWRHFAAGELHSGKIPLWNPFQFCGTPFLANGQSAVFYPLNFPFWLMDTARAFGWSAFLGSLIALSGTYALARRWKMSRSAGVLSATAFAFCGYLSAWALLPTLFQTACWLPACLLFYERAADDEKPARSTLLLALCLACALLAGHAQVFFYLLLALGLRQPFLRRPMRGLAVGIGALTFAFALCAAQWLSTVELALHSPRVAAGGPSEAGWKFVSDRALQISELPSFVRPMNLVWGSLSENFGYVGAGVCLLALCSVIALFARGEKRSSVALRQRLFALSLAVFGILYALATPLAKLFFFAVPGISSMGGTGRSLVLWSLGAALCAGFGLDYLRSKWKSNLLAPLALGVVALELGLNAFSIQPTAPHSAIYPQTRLTDYLAKNSSPTARVWFFSDKRLWRPSEFFKNGRNHPTGILPPNGAMVYGIYDINGYDSLSVLAYHNWVASSEAGQSPSPDFNGNMMLLQTPSSSILDSLSVRYIVFPQGTPAPTDAQKVLTANGCDVYQRQQGSSTLRLSGAAFYPGFGPQGFAPETFRLGMFVSLCALGFASAWWFRKLKSLE